MAAEEGSTENVPRCSRYWARPTAEGVPSVKVEEPGCEEAFEETEALEEVQKKSSEEERAMLVEEARH